VFFLLVAFVYSGLNEANLVVQVKAGQPASLCRFACSYL